MGFIFQGTLPFHLFSCDQVTKNIFQVTSSSNCHNIICKPLGIPWTWHLNTSGKLEKKNSFRWICHCYRDFQLPSLSLQSIELRSIRRVGDLALIPYTCAFYEIPKPKKISRATILDSFSVWSPTLNRYLNFGIVLHERSFEEFFDFVFS